MATPLEQAGFLVEALGARVERHVQAFDAIERGFEGDHLALGMTVVEEFSCGVAPKSLGDFVDQLFTLLG